MTSDPSPSKETGAEILNFRSGKPSARPTGTAPGLEKFEQDDLPDDYRHRMLVNLGAFLVVVLLVGGGYWVADTMARMRKDQDCVLSGRRNCAQVNVEMSRPR